jgi:hypothetical protein
VFFGRAFRSTGIVSVKDDFLLNGELSLGVAMTQSNTQFGSHIVYSYRHANGNVFQNLATDFSKKLCEQMMVHVFYNTLNTSESAALEGSLYQVLGTGASVLLPRWEPNVLEAPASLMLLSYRFSRSGGTGRRSRLKICRGSLPVWVRLPPPGPSPSLSAHKYLPPLDLSLFFSNTIPRPSPQ